MKTTFLDRFFRVLVSNFVDAPALLWLLLAGLAVLLALFVWRKPGGMGLAIGIPLGVYTIGAVLLAFFWAILNPAFPSFGG